MNKLQSCLTKIVSLLIIFTSQITFANSAIYLGVVENFKVTDYQSINPRVRVAFHLNDKEWQATSSNVNSVQDLKQSTKNLPDAIHWMGLYQGKKLGSFSSQKFSPALYSDVGIQKIIEPIPSSLLLPSSKVLQLPLKQFKNRPIIAIALENKTLENYFSKTWSNKPLTQQEKNSFLQDIQKKAAKIYDSYLSKNGDRLIAIKDNSTWYYWQKNSKPTVIGTGLNLIDSFDLNQDGNTAWIFLYNDLNSSDANNDGYVLFYDEFKKSVKFQWNYH